MKNLLLVLCGLVAGCNIASAQTTVVLQPDAAEGKDAELWSGDASANFGTWPELKASSWTFSGQWGQQRALIQFDLSQIPSDAAVVSAGLYLYGNYASSTEINSTQGGSNSGVIRKVTAAWDEAAVTWDNQPGTTTDNEIQIPETASPYQDYVFDVSAMVQEMVNTPSQNFGFMIRLDTETGYRRLVFSSSDAVDSTLHPKLVVAYTLTTDSCWTGTITPAGKDAELWSVDADSNFGDWPELKASAWTFGGVPGQQRALFDFDLISIPANATFQSAYLTLYGNAGSATETHSSQSGSNMAYVKRVIEPWDENTVTWNTQPATTDANQVILPESTSPYQDYVDIDVTQLVADMYNDITNSHGFMLQLAEESMYRRMAFKSGDGNDPDRFPTIRVCFNLSSAVSQPSDVELDVTCFPNPVNNMFSIQVQLPATVWTDVSVSDVFGRIVFEKRIRMNAGKQVIPVDADDFAPGVYFVKLKTDDTAGTAKVLKLR